MDYIRDFFIIVLIGIIFLLLQQSALVSFLGIRANFLLVFFVFCAVTRRRLSEYLGLLVLLLVYSFLFMEVWIFHFLFFALVALFLFFLRKKLPGRFFFDFFVLVILGSLLLFFGMPVFQEFVAHGFNFAELSFSPFGSFFLEIILNILIGFFLVFLGTRRFLIRIFS
jgi:hypothetical protein